MTGIAEYDEMPINKVLARWEALHERTYMARLIFELQARGEWNADGHLQPEQYPTLTTAEHVELLALGVQLARYYAHPAQVHRAVLAGATWEEIADAIGIETPRARAAYREWATGQHSLRQYLPDGNAGLDDAEYGAALRAASPTPPSGAR